MSKKQETIIDSNLTAVLGVTVKSYSEKFVQGKTATFYLIELTSHLTQKVWTIEKRYSEFYSLHEILQKESVCLPTIPGKTLGKVKSEEALNKRKELLQLFLRECVQRRDILKNPKFQEFLELSKNAPEIIGNNVALLLDYRKFPLGVRNFIVVPKREIMLVCCSNMNFLSRSNVSLTNLALAPKSQDFIQIPMGAAFIYQCKPDKDEVFKIHKIWAKPFAVQTGTIHWEDTKEYYSIGLDDGKVFVYKGDSSNHYLSMDKVYEGIVHGDRVMGVGLDPFDLRLYTCSTDRTFCAIDLTNAKFPRVLVKISDSGYTNMELESSKRRIFLTNQSGEITIFSIKTFPPNLVKRLKTSSHSTIRAFHISYPTNYIFIGDSNGRICTFDLPKEDKERLMSEISHFGVGQQKIRVCVCDPINFQLITGDQSGKVTIWDLKKGKPIYLWVAHPKSVITQIWYQPGQRYLWTAGKDGNLRVWLLPQKWANEEVESFEENEVNNLTAKMMEQKFEKKRYRKRGGEEEDSDDDDLNGWNYRKY